MKKVVTYTKVLDVPEDKLESYKEAFDLFDKDHSGEISGEEIYRIMKNFGNPLTKQEIKKMIDEIDTNGNNELDFEEFVTFMKKTEITVNDEEEEEILKAFRSFDKDKSGFLSPDEFRFILTQIGTQRLSENEVNQLFIECDLDKDGKLNYQEFINFWKQ